MKKIRVNLGKKSYDIVIGSRNLHLLPGYLKKLAIGKDALIITTPNIKRLIGKKITVILKNNGFACRIETVPDSEKSKSESTAFKLINKISSYGRLKQIFIIALGGGVVGDLSGFVASVYKRGVPFVQLPTTLLAQIDSSIGGKVGIDLSSGKNLVGSFYQPRLVFCDISLLKTLPPRQIKSGLAEAVKYGIIKDKALFEYIEKRCDDIMKLKEECLEYIVARCAAIKAKVVSLDEEEKKGVRTILNFGHTIGHAIEAAGNFKKYNHGEAITLGMLAAVKIARDLKIFDNAGDAERIKAALADIGLPIQIKGLSARDIMIKQSFDKKFIRGKNRFVLPKKIGKVIIKEGIADTIIKNAVKELLCCAN